ncbi:MAG: hypothetical protein V1774_04090 [Candidatus Eisenbacteria bacterium]
MTADAPKMLEFIEVHIDSEPVCIRVDEIQRFEAVGGHGGRKSRIVFRHGHDIIVDETPEQLKQLLESAIIIRTQTR